MVSTQDQAVLGNDLSTQGNGYWFLAPQSGGDGNWASVFENGLVTYQNGTGVTLAGIEYLGSVGDAEAIAAVDQWSAPAFAAITRSSGNVVAPSVIANGIQKTRGPVQWFYNSWQMWGVCGATRRTGGGDRSDLVYGLFSTKQPNSPGWSFSLLVPVGTLGDGTVPVTTLGGTTQSVGINTAFIADDKSMYAAASDGGIYRFVGGGSVTDPLPTPDPKQPETILAPFTIGGKFLGGISVVRFAQTTDGTLFAAAAAPGGFAVQGQQFPPTGFLLTRDRHHPVWVPAGRTPVDILQAAPIMSICADTVNRLYVATPSTVYVLDLNTHQWYLAVGGLPTWPNCTELIYDEQGTIYLATYGWSLWKTPEVILDIVV
jgi:hypothetical protein